MSRRIPKDLVDECLRLRREEDASALEVHRRTGVNVYSVYRLLRTSPRKAPRNPSRGARWTLDHRMKLFDLYPTSEREVVEAALVGHTWDAIVRRASEEKIKRLPAHKRRAARYPAHPMMRRLREIREEQGTTRVQFLKRSGYLVGQILSWELGKTCPRLAHVVDLADCLGYDVDLRRRDGVVEGS